ncbi:MAG: DinB family protein [Flavobacteriales bacterium]|nr:DinB family protein [Flavobacteriales bacterium]
MKIILDQLADYGLWANTRFVQRLQREADEVLDRNVPSSFPSLRSTLLHIRDAENAWHARLRGVPVIWPASPERAIEDLLKYTLQLRDLARSYDDADLGSTVLYHDLRGNEHRQTRWHMLLHCFNHSTQHRGQLITMMRALGLEDIPANDLVVFQRSLPK